MKKSFILIALCALTFGTYIVKAKPPGTKDPTCDPKLPGCKLLGTGD